VNDPSLIALVNKLQDVFTTVGVSANRPSALLICLLTHHDIRFKIR
jgi:hypothetical protein